MMELSGKRVAVLVTSGVEEVELTQPVQFLREHGAEVTIITPKQDELLQGIKTLKHDLCGNTVMPDALLSDVSVNDFDALLIPGGLSPDHLRLAPGAAEFAKAFGEKLIFAICHGPQLLVNADLVQGRTLTSWPAIAVDLNNAGAHWVDQQVCVDGNLITSRMPADIPAFDNTILDALVHPEQFRKAA
jgi:protease I